MTRLTPSPNGQHAGPGFATLPKLQFVAPTAKPPPPPPHNDEKQSRDDLAVVAGSPRGADGATGMISNERRV
jgi:hypothetical protein